MSSALIVIPARYGSTRFPGKPLAMIAGATMLSRVVHLAREAAEGLPDVEVVVATDHDAIADHCAKIGVRAVMTPSDCATGSDRAMAAMDAAGLSPELILNLQGDAPMTRPAMVRAVLETLRAYPEADVVTPVVPLNWDELDAMRAAKARTPFSGTTVVCDPQGRALWFSKQILPAIRGEDVYRDRGRHSPVLRHIGLYGYRLDALRRFVALEPSRYEVLEGLEQLRLLENGFHLQTVTVEPDLVPSSSGVDTPEDVARLEQLIRDYGDPMEQQ